MKRGHVHTLFGALYDSNNKMPTPPPFWFSNGHLITWSKRLKTWLAVGLTDPFWMLSPSGSWYTPKRGVSNRNISPKKFRERKKAPRCVFPTLQTTLLLFSSSCWHAFSLIWLMFQSSHRRFLLRLFAYILLYMYYQNQPVFFFLCVCLKHRENKLNSYYKKGWL